MGTKRTTVVLLLAFALSAGALGCKKVNTQHVTTLQGTIFNAITGERIGGDDLKMYLQQGTLLRRPDVFYTGEKIGRGGDNATIDLMGDYAFANIPSMDNMSGTPIDANPNEYRMTVINKGYQRFEGIIDNDMLANKDNVIRNIYLFPEDFFTPCYVYTAKFNGKAVPSLPIVAMPYATLNPGIIATDKWLSLDLSLDPDSIFGVANSIFTLFNNNYFFPAPGYLASTAQITDADGQVSLCEDLAAGGAYAVCTGPINFEGVDLMPACKILVAGFSDPDQVFNLRTIQDTGNDFGLYATSVSNAIDGSVEPTGTLTITFNRAVTLNGSFTATEDSAAGALNVANPVIASLSADGLTLTLAPNWLVAPGANEVNTFVYYADGTASLSVNGYPGTEIAVFNCAASEHLEDNDENCISGTVQIKK